MREWEGYFENDFDEGLGTVYERFMLDGFWDRFLQAHPVRTVLEVPLHGLAGVPGLNSFPLAQRGCQVTLGDDQPARLRRVAGLWQALGQGNPLTPVEVPDFTRLPWADRAFDLAWNFAALWHLERADRLVEELCRVSAGWLFLGGPNPAQVGYLFRKAILDREFFRGVHEQWLNRRTLTSLIQAQSWRVVEEGVLDVPPWPDAAMPVGEVIRRLGLRPPARLQGPRWRWSSLDYYSGAHPGLKAQVERWAFLERGPFPRALQRLWAHHHYLLAQRLHSAVSDQPSAQRNRGPAPRSS